MKSKTANPPMADESLIAHFHGTMRDLRIYKRAISPQQIQAMGDAVTVSKIGGKSPTKVPQGRPTDPVRKTKSHPEETRTK